MKNKKDLSTPRKDGIEVVKMTTKKVIRCRYGYGIAKGTPVNVDVETKNGQTSYSVHYPKSEVLRISAKATDFEPLNKKPIKTKIKVGDEFWFESMRYNTVWKDKVVDIEDGYAYFKNHHNITGEYGIPIRNLEKLKEIYFQIFPKSLVRGRAQSDTICVSKNEKELVESTLKRISEIKQQAEQKLEDLRQEFTQKLEDFQSIENQEKEFTKRLKNL